MALAFLGDVPVDEFLVDEKLKRAVCMTVINVGELVKGLDFDFRKAHSEIPWRLIAGFRDVAAHRYQSLRMEDVYATVAGDFPRLVEQLRAILAS